MHDRQKPPFYIDKEEEQQLRNAATRLAPSAVVQPATTFDDYARQLMIPSPVMELARKASQVQLTTWEAEGIHASLKPKGGGILRYILEQKAAADPTHPPYIRIAVTGRGVYDEDAREKFGYRGPRADERTGDYGSPAVLEIWPAQHYSPIHSHGDTTGIVYCLYGRLDNMVYGGLEWDAEKLGLMTLYPGQCAWLTGDRFAVHKVFCPADGGAKPVGLGNPLNDSCDFGASFHVYLNQSDLTDPDELDKDVGTRDIFRYVDEVEPHEKKQFKTYSDLSWNILRSLLAARAGQL